VIDPPLAGALVRLEPLRPEHGDALFAVAASDPAAFRGISDPIGASRQRFDVWFEQALADDGPYATVDAATGEPAQFEGVHRKHMLVPGLGVRDSAWFSIVDDEWPEVRARLRARLDAHAR
jgi:hypothetical protein